MARTTIVEPPPVRRVAAAVGAAALAWVGVVGTDIPASVVTTSTTVHVSGPA